MINKEIPQLYKQVQRDRKEAFVMAMSTKYNRSQDTLHIWLYKGKVPTEFVERLKNDLNIQLDYDNKVNEQDVKHFEILSNG